MSAEASEPELEALVASLRDGDDNQKVQALTQLAELSVSLEGDAIIMLAESLRQMGVVQLLSEALTSEVSADPRCLASCADNCLPPPSFISFGRAPPPRHCLNDAP